VPSRFLLAFGIAAAVGCAGEPAATVRIEAPQEGAVVTGDSVPIELSASGVGIVPADGESTPGRAHHHLVLDVDPTPAGQEIPKQVEGIVHLGTGASSFTLKDLTAGRHRLIAVLALGDHVPLDPWAVDTVFFTVVEGGR